MYNRVKSFYFVYFFLSQSQEVEETLKRIQSHKGVVGTIVVNNEGIPVKSTLDNTSTVQYAGLMSQLSDKARSVVRDLDPSNDLSFLRVRSKKHEIMVAPDKDFLLIVIQNPTD
ncbi:dynein light chain roadblock-type 2 [Anopheles maculipalpis]|uniref:dynein light chain roadblock-type 2 n=1 Tax=Anopheles maculipalpis TaxID=1496333 RepID=UPI002158E855|nr:dynein light chain roadblock-type 2 [Anopheles maculipalpis]